LNAANEVAVAAFLEDEIGFLAMSDLNEYCMNQGTFIANPSLEDYIESDKLSRILAQEWVGKQRK
jgi:1-deoxy-D-xylulose-5-phosphate reductoisomerase